MTKKVKIHEKYQTEPSYARSLIEASLDPLVTISADGKITDVNKATEEATGCTREELIGSDFSDYFTKPEEARAGYEKVFTQGYVRDYPLTIRHKSGKITHVLYNATVFLDKTGKIRGVFAAARDITEHKIAEEKLMAASLYARSLIEASLDPLVTISTDGKITDVNKATEDVTGYLRVQLIGSDFSDYFTDPQRARAGYKQVFTKGFVKDYPLAIRHKSGKITEVLYNASVYRDANGEVQGVFAAARDISERKKAEEAVARQAELINLTPDAIIVMNLKGETYFWSKGAERLYGWSETEVAGKQIHDLLKTQFPEPIKTIINEVKQTGIWSGELQQCSKDGKEIIVQSRWAPKLDKQGHITEILKSNVDITERKAMENEIRQTSERLKQSNAELEQFGYVASHDLQEPLRMVASYVQLLERRYKGKLDADADEFIDYAVDGANRMRSLIDDLLTYSRVSRLGKPFEPTNIEDTMQIVLNNLQPSIIDNKATVTYDKLPVVIADSSQMVQLFQNLIGNAIKFHGQELPRVHVSAKSQDNMYQFAITDNGIGIDPQYFNRLFKIFHRLHTKQEYPGSGIGLVICKRIVERHGGRIWLESQVGKGSTVYFTLSKEQGGNLTIEKKCGNN